MRPSGWARCATSRWAGWRSPSSRSCCTTPDVGTTILVALGGLLYTIGAVVYATRKPDPVPLVFGYHEVFHALVIAAAALQFAAVAIVAL